MRDRKGFGRGAALGVLAASLALATDARGVDHSNAPQDLSRVGIENAWTRNAVQRAIRGAQRRLSQPRCQTLLTEFTDAGGRPLKHNLAALDQTGHGYLELVLFRDGQDTPQCSQRFETLAYTARGSRVVFVCGPRFLKHRAKDPSYTEFIVIHELLHTLGLGENPPHSLEITARVNAVCR